MTYDGPRRMECIECNSAGFEPEFAKDGCVMCSEDLCKGCSEIDASCSSCCADVGRTRPRDMDEAAERYWLQQAEWRNR